MLGGIFALLLLVGGVRDLAAGSVCILHHAAASSGDPRDSSHADHHASPDGEAVGQAAAVHGAHANAGHGAHAPDAGGGWLGASADDPAGHSEGPHGPCDCLGQCVCPVVAGVPHPSVAAPLRVPATPDLRAFPEAAGFAFAVRLRWILPPSTAPPLRG